MGAQLALNQLVVGSNPSSPTIGSIVKWPHSWLLTSRPGFDPLCSHHLLYFSGEDMTREELIEAIILNEIEPLTMLAAGAATGYAARKLRNRYSVKGATGAARRSQVVSKVYAKKASKHQARAKFLTDKKASR